MALRFIVLRIPRKQPSRHCRTSVSKDPLFEDVETGNHSCHKSLILIGKCTVFDRRAHRLARRPKEEQ